jgi:DNA-3-methyladenine glycosylase
MSSNVAVGLSTNNNRANGRARKGLTVLSAIEAAKWERVFAQPTVAVARELIGASLIRIIPPDEPDAGDVLVGRIVETEAYLPLVDPACHGYRGPTPRNGAIFGRPGHAYVYFIYGNHYCFNVTTEPAGIGGAVLIRALEPLSGLAAMRRRRRAGTPDAGLACGPGNLCRAIGIDRTCDGVDLRSGALRLDLADVVPPIGASHRIGIRAAATWPLRFVDLTSKSISPFRSSATVWEHKSR